MIYLMKHNNKIIKTKIRKAHPWKQLKLSLWISKKRKKEGKQNKTERL